MDRAGERHPGTGQKTPVTRTPDAATPDRERLLRRYCELVDVELPARARQERWSLRFDHCFGRVLLDDAVGGCWYDALDRRSPAYRQLDDAQLAGAVAVAERLLVEGDPLLRQLDDRSLAWRGKAPKRRPVSGGAARRG